MKRRSRQLLARARRPRVDLVDRLEHDLPALEEERVEHLVLGLEVVVDEAVGDARLVGDVRHAAGVEALAREHAHGRVEDQAALVDRRRPSRADRLRPPVRRRPAVGERRQLGPDAARRSRSRSATTKVSASGAVASTTPHGSTIIERPPERIPARARRSGWPRPRSTGPRSPAPAAAPPSGRASSAGERGRDGEHLRAAHREDAVELGEAQVVADGQAQAGAAGGSREHDLVARRLVLGLAVGAAADLDVEHVDLAVDRAVLAVGPDVHARCCAPRSRALDALGDRAGDEVDPELARRRRAPRSAPGRRAARRPPRSARACRARATSRAARRARRPARRPRASSRSAASRLRSRSGVELSWTAAARIRRCPRRQIDSSVKEPEDSRACGCTKPGPGSAASAPS